MRKAFTANLRRVWKDENGSGLADYAMLLFFLASGLLILCITFQEELSQYYLKIVSTFRQMW